VTTYTHCPDCGCMIMMGAGPVEYKRCSAAVWYCEPCNYFFLRGNCPSCDGPGQLREVLHNTWFAGVPAPKAKSRFSAEPEIERGQVG